MHTKLPAMCTLKTIKKSYEKGDVCKDGDCFTRNDTLLFYPLIARGKLILHRSKQNNLHMCIHDDVCMQAGLVERVHVI